MAQLSSLVLLGNMQLPVGLWVEGIKQSEISIRALSGRDEEAIGDEALWHSPAAQVSALLAATITRIGDLAPVKLEHVHSMTVLDRDIALIGLHLHLFGDRIQSTVKCPNIECGKPIDIDFCLSELPIPDRNDAAPQYVFIVDGKNITYRLPTGIDQEVVSDLARNNNDQAAQTILERCVEHFNTLSPEQVIALQEEMARRDPQLDTDFNAHCPECGKDFTLHFDIQDFLLRKISGARQRLYQQVHTLAWYYHWSEAEIMTLPFQKRQIYINLLSDLISEIEEARL
jgi:hypothetical protein